MKASKDQNDVDAFLAESEWRFDIDGLTQTLSMEQKDIFIDEVTKYFLVIKCQPMLNQLIDGLKYYDVSVFKFFWQTQVFSNFPDRFKTEILIFERKFGCSDWQSTSVCHLTVFWKHWTYYPKCCLIISCNCCRLSASWRAMVVPRVQLTQVFVQSICIVLCLSVCLPCVW